MDVKPFKIEEWMNAYEDDAIYNLAETCVDSFTAEELISMGGADPSEFLHVMLGKKLTYGHIEGSPDFREGVAGLYETLSAEHVLAMNGAIGANFLVLYSLVKPGDEVICVDPTYQQLMSVPASFGAKVKPLYLRERHRFLPDLDELRDLVTEKTSLIIINNPNNPTGALLGAPELNEIADLARSVDAYVLCDEVYRGLVHDPDRYVPSMADVYEKGISTGSMSKALSLAGLRLGWIAARSDVIDECMKHRDYTTISCGMIDDMLASHALDHYDEIMDRNLKIVRENGKILDDWVQTEPKISYTKPEAGTTAMLKVDVDMPSEAFCHELFMKNGAFLAPGSCFGMEGYVRIGYACSTRTLREGLAKVSEHLADLP